MSVTTDPPRHRPEGGPVPRKSRSRRTSLFARGEPMVWLTGGALAVGMFMIVGLLLLVVVNGLATFWAGPVVCIKTFAGETYMGEPTREESYVPSDDELDALPPEIRERADREMAENDGEVVRRLYRTENFGITGRHFHWVNDFAIVERDEPEWAVVVERQEGGRFYGFPEAFLVDGEETQVGAEAAFEALESHHDEIRDRFLEIHGIREDAFGDVQDRREQGRLALKEVELDHGKDSKEYRKAAEEYDLVVRETDEESARWNRKLAALTAENDRYAIRMSTVDGVEKTIPVANVVRAYAANRQGLFSRVGLYLSRWWEFLTEKPREANNEGGVWPAIFGTVLMTLIMTILVVPFGVLAALYLREYAKAGPVVSTVRIAINNLAGVPSIVFGVFGLGFFCYVIGAQIDELFFQARLPNPTFGKSGLLWASLTLALLTLPVVIVATEEALAAVPSSMREGSYACGASKWQTIRRIVLPRAAPGIMTGTILAIARGAGEVAPLMLVGAVKLTKDVPGGIDGIAPYVHVERSFMHLGFHIYDLGFQSPNAEAAKPMVFSTTLLLIGIVVALNVVAIVIRTRLRRRFETGHF